MPVPPMFSHTNNWRYWVQNKFNLGDLSKQSSEFKCRCSYLSMVSRESSVLSRNRELLEGPRYEKILAFFKEFICLREVEAADANRGGWSLGRN